MSAPGWPRIDARLKVGPLAKLGPQTFSAGGFSIQYYREWLIITNGDTIAHVLTFTLKSVPGVAPTTASITLGVGETESYPTEPFVSVSIDTASAAVTAFYSDRALSSTSIVKLGGNQTLYDTAQGTGSASSSVTLFSSAVVLPIGTYVAWVLGTSLVGSWIGILGQGTGALRGIAIGAGQLFGSFVMTEKDLLEVRLNTSGATYYSFFYQATSP